jgi:WD40 repeat protein
LNIYKKDTYDLQLSIKEHSDGIYSFTELHDRRIITCSYDKTMKIIKLIGEDKYQIEQTLQGHTSIVCKIIEIKENELISISIDKTMKIWKLNNENKFECIKTINFQNSGNNCNILKLNENEFVTSSCGDKCIKFWNSNDYSNIATINNIESSWTWKNMCLLENDLLCVGGDNSKGFYLIKISTHQLIKNIIGPKTIYSINKCLDGLFLCSIIDEKGNNSLVKYKYEEQDLKKVIEKEKAHDDYIYSCVELNDKTIVSGGIDCLIKLWKD